MIAVCPLTTAGAPAEEVKEPAIAHIPKPTAPTPANSFNPLVIMACAPKKWRRRLHARLPTIAGCASAGPAHAFTSSRFVLYEPRDIRYRRFQHTMFCFRKTMCRIFCDQNFTESATHSLIDFTGALLSR